jgi:hypothetical protein
MLLSTFFLAALFAPTTLASTTTVSFDTFYDNPGTSLYEVDCSDGPYGLIPKGYTTFGSLPPFPYIGGSVVITGWGSPNCGTCWTLTYNGRSINVLAINRAYSGFSISLAAMNDLTAGQAVNLGVVNAQASQAPASDCGF